MLNSPLDKGLLFVVTGPSGVGKSTLISYAKKRVPSLRFSVSATTRPRRDGEVEGEDYYFLTDEEFNARLDQDKFLEHAQVYNHMYGTLRSATDSEISRRESVVLDIDLLGARQIQETCPDAHFIFILPPSLSALESRLRSRGKDTEAVIRRRMSLVAEQMQGCDEFDYVVMNDDLESAKISFVSIFEAEFSRVSVRKKWVQEAKLQAAQQMLR